MVETFAIIVAGGKGLRMGGEVPKQFLPIGGKPVLMYTIDAFRRALDNVCIVLVLPAEQHHYWQELCEEYNFRSPELIAQGGETRFHSVRNGLALLPDNANAVVGVHDGVRPFVSTETIRRCYAAAAEGKAVVPVVPVVETVRQILSDGKSVTKPRDEYRLVQTPQTFPLALLRQAYQQPYIENFTDDASVVEALGKEIVMIEGNRENIKLTTPEDLRFAEFTTMNYAL
ncbi:MAG: 2-C-methyl-D-erythritol 4-phosphate cytidylyltransferase [Bacteroidaceae bacterium]|nr:2-C-methyl-D-erythritol 4-phosphate cytidylyltransferase [Bacteroidaceae bacterium]